MGLNEEPEENGPEDLSLEEINQKAVLIFSAGAIESLLQNQAYLADQYFMLPPFSAEIQITGTHVITLYFKDGEDNFKEITFGGNKPCPDPETLVRQLAKIGFNIEIKQVRLFGIPAQEAKYLLREKKYRRERNTQKQ